MPAGHLKNEHDKENKEQDFETTFCMGMTVRNVYIIQMKNAYIIMTVNHRATIVITTRQKLEIEKLLVVRNGQFF